MAFQTKPESSWIREQKPSLTSLSYNPTADGVSRARVRHRGSAWRQLWPGGKHKLRDLRKNANKNLQSLQTYKTCGDGWGLLCLNFVLKFSPCLPFGPLAHEVRHWLFNIMLSKINKCRQINLDVYSSNIYACNILNQHRQLSVNVVQNTQGHHIQQNQYNFFSQLWLANQMFGCT